MKRYQRPRIRRICRHSSHKRTREYKAHPDKWVQTQLNKINTCAKRLNESGKLETQEIKKLQRNLLAIPEEQNPGSAKTQKRCRIFAEFLGKCTRVFGQYMALLCSCALARRTIADVGSGRRDALIKGLRTRRYKTETLTTLATKHAMARRPAEDCQFEYAPSPENMHAILDKMKEDRSMRLKCWVPVENAHDRPRLTFAIDRDLFWDIVDIANLDQVTTFIQDSSATSIVP